MWRELRALLFIILLVAVSVILLVKWITKYQIDESERRYNSGVCKCGGNYVYSQAIGHQYDTDYIYICDKCGSMVEIETYKAERKEE